MKNTPIDKNSEKVVELLLELMDNQGKRSHLYKTAFIKGMFSGVGGVIGATVLITLIVWLLSLFSEIPLLGRIVDVITDTIGSR